VKGAKRIESTNAKHVQTIDDPHERPQ
jgi:hypothetical protein